MYMYRVLSSRTSGNGLKIYSVLNLHTSEVLEVKGKFFRECGDSSFINVRVNASKFTILKVDKDVRERLNSLKSRSNLVLREMK